MRLYLVRHAEAAPGVPDELRPLTRAGRAQARELATRLAGEGVDAVLTSPLLRARETGAPIAREAGLAPVIDERLAPGATADDVLRAASGRGEAVVVVGHQPDCGLVAAELLHASPPAFPPAGLCAIDVP